MPPVNITIKPVVSGATRNLKRIIIMFSEIQHSPLLHENDRHQRLTLLGLTPADIPWATVLQNQVIRPQLTQIVDAFYEQISRHPAFHDNLIQANITLEQLKLAHGEYLLKLGQDFTTPAYFQGRIHVGLAHARVGFELSLYSCACQILQLLLVEAIPDHIVADAKLYHPLLSFIMRIMSLDMSLAIEAYHLTKIGQLKRSIQDLRVVETGLRHLVATDILTGAASHAHAMRYLRIALRRAQTHQIPLCVSMVDLDRFKLINDQYGHLMGDHVLKDVVSRMRSSVRDMDILGRYGGEEFIVIFYNTPLDVATQIAERLRLHVSATPLHVGNTHLHVSLSQGVAIFKNGDDIDGLLQRADQALYQAKLTGRNRVIRAVA